MNADDAEFVMSVLQAHTVAICALFATHPDSKSLLEALETIAHGVEVDPETLQMFRRSIP